MPDRPARLALDRTEITLTFSRPLGSLSAGIFVPGNMRGVMAAGLAGEVRVRAGRAVEDELLAHRPFSLGKTYPTGGGNLIGAGIATLAHGIVSSEPGETPKTAHSERALRAALVLFDDLGVRTVTLPLVDTVSGAADTGRQGQALGTLLAGHLRRGSRLRRVTLAGLDRDFLAGARETLIQSGAIPVEE